MINDFFERRMTNVAMDRLVSSKNRAVYKKLTLESSIGDTNKGRDLTFIHTPYIVKKEVTKTPIIKYNDRTFDDVEMRKTKKSKPPLMSNKLPSAFGFQKKSFM